MTKGHETCLMTHLPPSGTKRGLPTQQQHWRGGGWGDSRGGKVATRPPRGRLYVSASRQDSSDSESNPDLFYVYRYN